MCWSHHTSYTYIASQVMTLHCDLIGYNQVRLIMWLGVTHCFHTNAFIYIHQNTQHLNQWVNLSIDQWTRTLQTHHIQIHQLNHSSIHAIGHSLTHQLMRMYMDLCDHTFMHCSHDRNAIHVVCSTIHTCHALMH